MQQPQEPHGALLTAHDVGRRLGVDPSTVYRMAADGRLPAIKVGRQWRFPAGHLERALDRGVPAAATAAPAGADGTEAAARPAAAWPDAALVRAVVDLAAEALGVMMVVTDMAGRPVTPILHACPALAGRTTDPELLDACRAEWRGLAADVDFEPRFTASHLGFQCARALVRSGPQLIGMVLAGGIAAPGAGAAEGLYALTDAERQRVLRLLPRVAATLSRLAGHEAPTHAADTPAAGGGPR
jgi:excisionase family DNA binding protein